MLDGIVHGLGLVIAVAAGGVLLAVTALEASPAHPAVAIYVGSLLAVLCISVAFNLAPVVPAKRLLARFDQAAIFLLIAGTYTPVLAALWGTPGGILMTALVWGAAVVGVALKLIVPQHFGRVALALYLGIGWSGVLILHALWEIMPQSALLLLVAGGVTYSVGVIFHVWEQLKFHNVVWHCFVVTGASLHLWAMLDWLVLRS